MGFPGGSDGEESACNAGDLGSTPGLGRSPGRGHGNHYSVLAWRIPWTRSLVGYSPGGRTESNMTERLSSSRGDLNIFRSLMKTIYVDLGFDKAERGGG